MTSSGISGRPASASSPSICASIASVTTFALPPPWAPAKPACASASSSVSLSERMLTSPVGTSIVMPLDACAPPSEKPIANAPPMLATGAPLSLVATCVEVASWSARTSRSPLIDDVVVVQRPRDGVEVAVVQRDGRRHADVGDAPAVASRSTRGRRREHADVRAGRGGAGDVGVADLREDELVIALAAIDGPTPTSAETCGPEVATAS